MAAASRRVLLDIARRRARPGTGSAAIFLERRTAMATWPDLTSVLAGLPWAVVGAVATRAYMPERTTRDLDVLVAAAHAAEVRTRFREAGYEPVQELAIGGMTWRSPEGVLVDVIESALPWVPEALRSSGSDPQGLPILSLPYLVLTKVHAGPIQGQDLESLIRLGELEMGQ